MNYTSSSLIRSLPHRHDISPPLASTRLWLWPSPSEIRCSLSLTTSKPLDHPRSSQRNTLALLKLLPRQVVKYWELNSIRARGNVKEGLEVNSRPGSCRVLEWVQTDGPDFSLCAVPIESSGPGFCVVEQGLGGRVEVQRYTRPEMSERT